MLRKMMIALAAITFVGAVVATNTADARGFGGGGFRAGGFRGGFGGGFRGAGVRSGFVGPGRFGFRPAFGLRFGFGPRFAFRNRVFFPPTALCLRGCTARRRPGLWRLLLELATDCVGLAASMGLRLWRRLWWLGPGWLGLLI
jgi:hypothetical protein